MTNNTVTIVLTSNQIENILYVFYFWLLLKLIEVLGNSEIFKYFLKGLFPEIFRYLQ